MALRRLAKGRRAVIHRDGVREPLPCTLPELARHGRSKVDIRGRAAVVRGVPGLSGATVMCSDLRASAALAIAELVADGEDAAPARGTTSTAATRTFVAKLAGLGADVKRVPGDGLGRGRLDPPPLAGRRFPPFGTDERRRRKPLSGPQQMEHIKHKKGAADAKARARSSPR